MKMPTSKELGMNIKALLWQQKPQKFKEWQAKNQKQFVECLIVYLTKNNLNKPFIFKLHYQTLFYFSFINYQKELHLYNLLLSNGFNAEVANMAMDSIFKVDIIAQKGTQKYYFQVKNQIKNLENKDSLTLKNTAINNNYIPILAVKIRHNWQFYNLLINQKVEIF